MKKILISSSFILSLLTTANAQFGTSPWTAPTGTYTVPSNVTSLQIECWGGGGGGGGARAIYSNNAAKAAGGGGGGGAYSKAATVAVTPGLSITVAVGLGGNGGTNTGTNGAVGGTSSVSYNSTTVVSANGGNGGVGKSASDASSFGAGGLGSTAGIGFLYGGGNGAIGTSNSNGGGGGGGAGSMQVGGNASGLTAGVGGLSGGGAGGAGAYNNFSAAVAGSPGTVAGGGGGGAAAWSYTSAGTKNAAGGAGAAGQVIITYTVAPTGPYWLNQYCPTGATGSYIDGGTISPLATIQTISTVTNPSNYGYVFWTFNASAGSTYYFDLCSSIGTSDVSVLRLHNARNTSPSNNYCMDASNTPTLVMENNLNGCAGTGVGLSKLIWTCQTSGTYYLETAVGANRSFWGVAGSQTAVLNYKTLPSFSYGCSNAFNDKGRDGTDGASSSYNNNENWIYTYYPTDSLTEAIHVQFASFSTSPGDILCVYNGNSINSPLIGCYSGPSISGTFFSTATDGSLTFHFTSDDSGISTGWQATVTCDIIDKIWSNNSAFGNQIRIFPNPAKDVLWILGEDLHFDKLDIFNLLGEKIYSQKQTIRSAQSKILVDINSLVSGIYFISLANEKGVLTSRFVKQ